MMSNHVRSVFGLAAAMLFVCGAQAVVTFSDTEFVNSTWGFETVITGTGSSSGTQVAGGNPGFARQLTNTLDTDAVVYGFSRFGTNTATRYDFSLYGEITSVDYSIDSQWLSGIGGQGHSIMLGAKQGSVLYYAAHQITGSSGAWSTHSALGLVATDFLPLTAGAPIDFSAGAAPIRFGFVVGNSSTGIAYTNAVQYDNFNVVAHNVPAPGAALVGLAGLGAMARRRRTR